MDTEGNLPEEELNDTVESGQDETENENENDEHLETEDEEQDDTVPGGNAEAEAAAAAAAASPKNRAQERIRALAAERDREKEARIRAETLAAERERAPAQRVSADEAKRQREERLALMDPSERRDFEHREQLQSMQEQIARTQVQTQDILDRNGYNAKADANPIYAKHKAEVERRYIEGCKKGVWYPRETYLAVVVGEAALQAKPNTKGKEEARRRVDSTKGASVPARSNASSSSRNKGADRSEQELFNDLKDIAI